MKKRREPDLLQTEILLRLRRIKKYEERYGFRFADMVLEVCRL